MLNLQDPKHLALAAGAAGALWYFFVREEEEDAEDFGGIALSNPRVARRKTKSYCQKRDDARDSYNQAKKQRDKHVKDAGRVKSRSEKQRIENAQKAMNKYKGEYNNYKKLCEMEQSTAAYMSSKGTSSSSQSSHSSSSSRHPSGSSTGRRSGYDPQEAAAVYHSGKSSRKSQCDEAKSQLNAADRAAKKHKKKEPSKFWSKKKWLEWDKKHSKYMLDYRNARNYYNRACRGK